MDIYPIDMEVRRDIMNDSSVYGLYTELFVWNELYYIFLKIGEKIILNWNGNKFK